MPKYTIQVADGRKITLDSPDPDTALHDADAWASQNPAARPAAGPPATAPRKAAQPDRQAPNGVQGPVTGKRVPAPPMKTGAVEDVARSGGSGFVRGLGGLAASSPISDPIGFLGRQARMYAKDARLIGLPGADQAERIGTALDAMGAGATAERMGGAYVPKTTAGRYTKTVGEFAPGAMTGGGGVLSRTAQVVVPALTAQASADLAGALGADEKGQALAKVAGGLAGGFGVASRAVPRRQPTVDERGLAKLMDKARQSVPAMRARAAEFREAGIAPTLADVLDESGRGVVRATASRMTPAREEAQQFAEARTLNLPDRIGGQARRVISADPRTPAQIAADLAARRSRQAAEQFGAVRGEAVQLAPEGVQALRHPLARGAIAEAAQRERDPEVRAALNRLAGDALDDPSTPVTVGMLDRVSRVLNGQAGAAFRAGDNDLGATLRDLGDSLRTPTRQAVPGYDAALNNFAAESRLMGAAERGEDFLQRNTDEFVADLADLSPEEQALARATARRAVERAAGENVSAAPGVARRLAYAPEQQARNRALLGDADAQRFQQGVALEERAVQNARYVAPNTGSQTQGRGQDAAEVAGNFAQMGGQVARGDLIGSVVTGVKLWLKSRGISDAEAENLTRLALDPARTEDAIAVLQTRLGPERAREFVQRLGEVTRQALPAAAPPLMAFSRPEGR